MFKCFSSDILLWLGNEPSSDEDCSHCEVYDEARLLRFGGSDCLIRVCRRAGKQQYANCHSLFDSFHLVHSFQVERRMRTIALEFVCIDVIRLCHYQCRQRFIEFHGSNRSAIWLAANMPLMIHTGLNTTQEGLVIGRSDSARLEERMPA